MTEALLKVENVFKTFSQKGVTIKALQGLSFELGRGEFVSVLGPSGSGKSTLLRLLGGLERPTSGRIVFDEEEISSFRNNRRAGIRNKKVGFVFEAGTLLPGTTVLKNVELPLVYAGVSHRERTKRAQEELKILGLKDKLVSPPSELTLCEQVKVAIGRAAVNEPLVVLADEPTSLLDSKSEAEVMSVLERLNRLGTTLVLATHQRRLADHGARVISLLEGKVVTDRPVEKRKSAIKTLLEKE